jgi:hypothetical protein
MDTNEARQKATEKARAATEKTIEEVKVASNQLVDRVRDLIEEGNVRRIRVMKDDRTLLEVPLTIAAGAGAAVVLMNPVLAALGALAALLTDVTLVVERDTKAAAEQASLADGDDESPAGDGDKTIGK